MSVGRISGSRKSGIEGRWETLAEERDGLKEAKASLEKELGELREKLHRYETGSTELRDFVELVEERDDLQHQVNELSQGIGTDLLKPDDEEREVLDACMTIYKMLHETWKLKANAGEVAQALHVLQGFAVQHMLQRLAPGSWGNWYEERKN